VIRCAHSGKLCFLTSLIILVFIVGLEEIAGLANVLRRYFDVSLRIDLLKFITRLTIGASFLNKGELLIRRRFRPRLWDNHPISLLVEMALLICCGFRNIRRLLPMSLILITVAIGVVVLDSIDF
jgi:hypothetical protein